MAASTSTLLNLPSPCYSRQIRVGSRASLSRLLIFQPKSIPIFMPARNMSASAVQAAKPQTLKSESTRVVSHGSAVAAAAAANPSLSEEAAPCGGNAALALAVAAVASGAVINAIRTVAEKFMLTLSLNPIPRPAGLGFLVSHSSHLFFAAATASTRGAGPVATPYAVIAAGMAKWLQLYSCVLMMRVLLSWFPNIQWERQPMCAIRDLSDPYLNLFRNILPPVMGVLDISPMLAFFLLGFFQVVLGYH